MLRSLYLGKEWSRGRGRRSSVARRAGWRKCASGTNTKAAMAEFRSPQTMSMCIFNFYVCSKSCRSHQHLVILETSQAPLDPGWEVLSPAPSCTRTTVLGTGALQLVRTRVH